MNFQMGPGVAFPGLDGARPHRGPNPGRSKSGPGSCTGTTRSDGHTGGTVRDGDGLKGKAFLAKGPKMSMD